ncbi:MAG: hypothetical protein VKJ05_05360 [Synechococcaceae cyanobacterium]|nr:hypothetical protein [Synechococcaceae cyanobacterium]
MITLVLVIVSLLSLYHWLLSPFVHLATPLLSLTWLGWFFLAVAVWLFAGGRQDS